MNMVVNNQHLLAAKYVEGHESLEKVFPRSDLIHEVFPKRVPKTVPEMKNTKLFAVMFYIYIYIYIFIFIYLFIYCA